MIPVELQELYNAGRVIPFVGAGISRSVRWPFPDGNGYRKGVLWAEFVDQAIKILGVDEPELLRVRGTDLQILEYYAEAKGDNWAEVTNWFYQYMNPDDESLRTSPIHIALAGLTASPLFYTTNFDDFLERSFKLHGRKSHVIVEEDDISPRSNGDGCEIVKFHGDINHPNRMVISERHYELRLAFTDMLDYRFRSDLLNRVVVFLGYSFRDPNVAYLLRLFHQDQGPALRGFPNLRRAYVAVHHPSKFERTLFNSRKIGILPIENPDIEQGYVDLLSEFAK